MTKKKGFLLSYLKYGDNDAIIHCFTYDEGFESFYLRGIYSAKNKKKALLSPLAELYLDLNLKRKPTALQLLNQIEKVGSGGLDFNVKRASILFFTADFLNQVLKNENSQSIIYHEIELFISELEADNLQAHLIFLFKVLQLLGFAPLLGDGEYLDLGMGIFNDELSHQIFNKEISGIWKNILESSGSYSVQIPKNKSRELLNSLLIYYQFHVENFKIPISLEIVKEIFH